MDDTLVYDGWLKVFRRKIRDNTYDVLQDHDAVAAIILNERDDMLLVKQFRPALMRETLEIPSGTIDGDQESGLDCLVREIKEEACLDVRPEAVRHALSYKPNVGFSNSVMKIYLIRLAGSDLERWRVDGDDVYEAVWLSPAELEQRISAGSIQDVKTIIAYLYLQNHND